MKNIAYKVLADDGSPVHGGSGRYHFPHGKRPGKWMQPVKPVLCLRGYHLCRDARDLLGWLAGNVWLCEYRGEVVEDGDKICVEQVRLLRKVMGERELRLFACNCAERVLHLFEGKYPGDMRPREAIKVVLRYACGDATIDERIAAGSAAWEAVSRVSITDLAVESARAAAMTVDYDAAIVARTARLAVDVCTRIDAWCAELDWQKERLRWYLGEGDMCAKYGGMVFDQGGPR